MKKLSIVFAIPLMVGCGMLATTETSYYAAGDPPSERACDGPPSRAALVGDVTADGFAQSMQVRIFDDIGLLCEYGADNQVAATYLEASEGEATHVYTVVDDPLAANPVKTFGPVER